MQLIFINILGICWQNVNQVLSNDMLQQPDFSILPTNHEFTETKNFLSVTANEYENFRCRQWKIYISVSMEVC